MTPAECLLDWLAGRQSLPVTASHWMGLNTQLFRRRVRLSGQLSLSGPVGFFRSGFSGFLLPIITGSSHVRTASHPAAVDR